MEKYKGQLEGFPEWVVNIMLDRQEEQGNTRDVSVFEKNKQASRDEKGFDWPTGIETGGIWTEAIMNQYFQPLADFHKVDVHTGKPLGQTPHYAMFSDGDTWVKRILLADLGDRTSKRFITVIENHENCYLTGGNYGWTYYKQMKPLDPEPVKLTRKQIAEKFNIDENFELINE